MIRIIVTEGNVASGKSTFAKAFVEENENWVNICRDDIRAELTEKNEALVKKIRNQRVLDAIGHRKNIILSDTNFMNKNYEYALELQSTIKTPIEVELKQFFTPLNVCIERDASRENPIGKKVVMRMWNMYFKKVYEKENSKNYYKPDKTLPHCVIIDLDGTMALMNKRSPYEWHRVGEDDVNEPVRDVVELLRRDNHIIFLSGRDAVCYCETVDWLNENFRYSYELYMRTEGDNRDDVIVKGELFDKFIRDQYVVTLVMDDRQKVVDYWRSLGLTCFQVAGGNF
jgi:predicted kinase